MRSAEGRSGVRIGEMRIGGPRFDFEGDGQTVGDSDGWRAVEANSRRSPRVHFDCAWLDSAISVSWAAEAPTLAIGDTGMETLVSFAGFAGSAVSMLTTLYFWFVRMRRERPYLKPQVVDKEFYLGLSRDEVRQIGLKVGLIVANYSVLPNAILGARMWVRLRNGWQEVGHLAFDKLTPQPFNIPPLQTVLLRLTGTLSFPYDNALEEGSKTTANYLTSFLAQPHEMKLELRSLDEGADTHVLTVPTEMERSASATRSSSVAA